jgi:hypothetical protein
MSKVKNNFTEMPIYYLILLTPIFFFLNPFKVFLETKAVLSPVRVNFGLAVGVSKRGIGGGPNSGILTSKTFGPFSRVLIFLQTFLPLKIKHLLCINPFFLIDFPSASFFCASFFVIYLKVN